MLPASRSRSVLATVVSGAKVTLVRVALERTKQIRPDAVRLFRSFTAHFAFREHSCGRDRLRRYRSFGGDHPANVRRDAKGGEILLWLC